MTYIHPTALIEKNVILEEGVYVGPYCIVGFAPEWKNKEDQNYGVIIKKGSRLTGLVSIDGGAERTTVIGENAYIMKHAYIAHDCVLGNNVTISAGVKIAGYCNLADNINLGMGVCVHQKSNLPEGIMVGMNGVITKKSVLEPYQKYVGSPVKHIGRNERR
jgi:UDP-N-acetylglucosamine acyltransferase